MRARPLVLAGMVTVLVALAALPGPAGGAAACEPGFAPLLQGRPEQPASGMALWRDAAGWHLRVRGPSRRTRTYRATLRAGGPVRDARHVSAERGDRALLVRGREVRLRLRAGAGDTDGVDFRAACAELRVAVDGATPRLGRAGALAPARTFTARPDGRGGVRGVVVVGPACAVEQPGQDCGDRPYPTTVHVLRGGRPVASAETDAGGAFELALPAGAYDLAGRSRDPGQPHPQPRPTAARVVEGLVTDVVVRLDSGLRRPGP